MAGSRGVSLFDIVGKRFGELTVISEAEPLKYQIKHGKFASLRQMNCRCWCGHVMVKRWDRLKQGRTKSCGFRKDCGVEKEARSLNDDIIMANDLLDQLASRAKSIRDQAPIGPHKVRFLGVIRSLEDAQKELDKAIKQTGGEAYD